ncbi:MAG: hypothetical protein L6R41_001921 [Letrouitia leprolyta]|nr:MAG: hypothetical protein L6R41_001921 [Letrouitia leprolyta]
MRSFTFLVAAFAALAAAVPKPHDGTPASSGIVVLADIVYLNSDSDKVHRSLAPLRSADMHFFLHNQSTELVNGYIEKVYDNEPDTLEYNVNIEETEAKFVIYAVYVLLVGCRCLTMKDLSGTLTRSIS